MATPEMYFSHLEEEHLIELVRKYPLLYSFQDSSYKDQKSKANAWKYVAEEIGKTENACKAKWKYLRDWYIKKKKEGKIPTESGPLSAHLLARCDHLRFLDNCINTRVTASTIQEAIDEDDHTEMPQQYLLFSMREEESELEQSLTQSQKSGQGLETIAPKEMSQTIRQQLLLEHVKTSRERLEVIKQIAAQNSSGVPKHPIDEFFGAMASIVKELPATVQVQVKREVSQIVLSAECKEVSTHVSQETTSNYNCNHTSN